MPHRVIENEKDIYLFANLLGNLQLPVTVQWEKGKGRSIQQNRLQRQWCNEVAEQLGDQTPEEVRGFCKLTMAVPILRAEDEIFCAAYDKSIRSLPYEAKLACMMEPIDFPVTRRMNVRQTIRFLDHMHRYWTERGLRLTEPDAELAAYQSRYRNTQTGEAA
jgi:hypothetical protein